MLPGFATPAGTTRFSGRFPAPRAAGFYRNAQSLSISSLGIGTYLGKMDADTDRGYTDSVVASIQGGINFIDTSLNYRNQRSERSIGAAILSATSGIAQRDEFVVCTKAGYLTPGAVPELNQSDIVGGMHSMAPAFLDDQLQRSRQNLGIETIDVFYLHNPETQLAHVTQEEFYARVRQAFEALEAAAAAGNIRNYGAATWNGYRIAPGSPEALSLDRMAAVARDVAGDAHHFRFVQLPFNLAMTEAFSKRFDGENFLEAAARLGISVVASASLLQARLSRNLPDEIREKLAGAQTDAQRAIQFARSTPGIATALVGMSTVDHVRENLALAAFPPVTDAEYQSLYA